MAENFKIFNTYVAPATDLGLDIGSASYRFNNGFFGGSLTVVGSFNLSGDLDMGDRDIHSIRKLFGLTDTIIIEMSTTGRLLLTAPGSGTPFATPDFAFSGSSSFDDDIGLLVASRLRFRDADISIHSDADGHLDLTADVSIDFNADLDIADAFDIILGTTTGTKFGTATTQKLAFWNATPVAQQVATTELRTILENLGLIATGQSKLIIQRLDIQQQLNAVCWENEVVAWENDVVFYN